ncbi:AMP-dependent synthetase/ligase [Microbacterium sp. RD1]|uniref:AMP-dependent synthetase/ligase n=1 Tax=Microbacterium sp. RD1 TaxID=3457313 RepID=UPI003FA59249
MAPSPRTLTAALAASAAKFPDRPALRTVDGSVELSWREFLDIVQRLAARLSASGIDRGDQIALLLPNRPEWQLIDAAALWCGAIPFSLFMSSSVEQNVALVERSGARLLVIDETLVSHYIEAVPEGVHLIAVDEHTVGTLTAGQTPLPPAPSDPDDVATIIYTSGTTGAPKGVELTHRAILFVVSSLDAIFSFSSGRTISYLPHAHIVDRVVGLYIPMISGSTVTDIGDPMRVFDSLARVRPTFFTSVPRIWTGLRARLLSDMAASENGHALVARVEQVAASEPFTPDEDLARVAHPFLRSVGLDAVGWCITGSAPLDEGVHRFFAAVGLPLHDLWGLSETVAVATVMAPGDWSLGDVGRPLPNTRVRLASDDEILVRGPHLARGYRGDPDATAAAFDADGWFHTGDTGAWTDDGRLRIIGRKKEMIISSGGENMSPVQIEAALLSSPDVEQTMVVGDARPYNIALIVPAFDAEAVGITETRRRIDVAVRAANSRLSRAEHVRQYAVLAAPWTVGGGELTATLKMRRGPIAEKYRAQIDEAYRATPLPREDDRHDRMMTRSHR